MPVVDELAETADEIEAPQEDFELELQLRDYVDQFSTRVRSHCRRFTHDSHDADDATQQTFIALARQLRAMKTRGETFERPLAWLLQVAKRSSIDTVRARKRRRTHERAAAEQRDEVAPRNAASDLEARLAVQQTLDTLPAAYRTPMILFYFGGQDLDAIAQQLSLTTNAVSVKLHRGRSMLAKRLRARGVIVPALILPLLLAEVIREHIFNNAGASLMIGPGTTTTLHASSSILCGSAFAASSSTALPTASFLHIPLIQSRISWAIAAMVVITSVSAGGSGLVNHMPSLVPQLKSRFDLLKQLRSFFQSPPRFIAINDVPSSASATKQPEHVESASVVMNRPRFPIAVTVAEQYVRPQHVADATSTPVRISQANILSTRSAPPVESIDIPKSVAQFSLSTPFERPRRADTSLFSPPSASFAIMSAEDVLTAALPAMSETDTNYASLIDFDADTRASVGETLASMAGAGETSFFDPTWGLPFTPIELDDGKSQDPSFISPEPGGLVLVLGGFALCRRRR